MLKKKDQRIILFDGVCNLCNSVVRFVLKRDKDKKFKFASLQSATGQEILRQFNLPLAGFNSFILYQDGEVYSRSTGALKMLSQLKGWKAMKLFFILPRFLRDAVYNLVAYNRYKWFGKKEECWVPTPALRERFLE